MAQHPPASSHRRREHEMHTRHTHPEWEAKEAQYIRELDEAKARAAQMEKTMRWWSDCTANWREKWSKVRNERNKAREEAKIYKNKVETITRELAALSTAKHELEQRLMESKSDNEKLLSISESRIVSGDLTEECVEIRKKNSPTDHSSRQRASLDSHKFNIDNTLANKLNELRLKLDETSKSLQSEKDQKSFLMVKVETLTSELHNTKMELTHSDRTLGSTESSHSEVERLQNELQDEISSKQVLEEKLAEYKMEIERLKSENTLQWSKRELLETENIAIIRENNKLYNQVCELREQIHNLNRISDNVAYVNIISPKSNHDSNSNVCHIRKTKSSHNPSSLEVNPSNGDSKINMSENDLPIVRNS